MTRRFLFFILLCTIGCACSEESGTLTEVYDVPAVQLNHLSVSENWKQEVFLFFDDLKFEIYLMDTLYSDGELPIGIADKIFEQINLVKISQLDRIYNVN